jgi:iron complex transport system substrate-binding protein
MSAGLPRRWCLGLPLLGLAPAWAQVQRLVSVGGAVTETVFALGGQSRLVGVDSSSLFPQAATQMPNVGYARSLSAEGLLALQPQLVIASGEAGPPRVLAQLRSAGVQVEVMPEGHHFDTLQARTQRVATLLGRAPEPLLAQLRLDWQQALAAVPRPAKPPRVLFVLAHAPNQLRVAGTETAADAMLQLAGVRNALAGLKGYQALTPEAALQAAPDVILCTDQGLQAVGGVDGLLRAPGLGLTPAGRAQRVVSMEALTLLGFGPRLPQAVRTLAGQLHGTA